MCNHFMAGAAKADITPKIGTLLYGYNPTNASTSIHDPLTVTALAVSQGEDTAILVSATLGAFGTEVSNELREKIGAVCSIPASRVILAATHTHCAPNVVGVYGWGDVDRAYLDEILIPNCLKACAEAVASLVPAEYAVGVVDSQVGINRREVFEDGVICLGQNPWGCYDPAMTCVAIRNSETKNGILNMIHYGCHGTAAGLSTEISRDWSGIMEDRLEAESGILTSYWNGAEGDVGPRLTNGRTTGDMHYVEELGGVAAADAIRAWKACGMYVSGDLHIYEGTVSIPRKPLLSREEATNKLNSYSEPEKLVNIDALRYRYYRSVADEYDAGAPLTAPDFSYHQTIVSLGNVAFIPLPFEYFSEISLRLSRYSPIKYTLCLSNANGCNIYLPTEDQIVKGGYEIQCFLLSSAHPLVNNADQILIEENLKILRNK